VRTGSRISVTNAPVARLRSERAEPRAMLQRLASKLGASPDRGWGSIPRPSNRRFAFGKTGRSGDARRFRRALASISVLLLSGETYAATHAEEFAEIPSGMKVILFSLKDDPQVVTYDPEKLSHQALTVFAADLCDSEQAYVKLVSPWLAQRLRRRNRAHIFCMGAPQ